MVQDYEDGGLRMTHVASFIQSLKVKWLHRLLYSNATWTELFDDVFPISFHDVLCFGEDHLRKVLPTVRNEFWRDTMDAVIKYRERFDRLSEADEDPRYDSIWHNSKIKIAGQSICYTSWKKQGLWYVGQMYNHEGRLLSFNEFKEKFGFSQVQHTVFFGLSCVIRQSYGPSLNGGGLELPHCPSYLTGIMSCNSGPNRVYKVLLSAVKPKENHYQAKWNRDLGQEVTPQQWSGINQAVISHTSPWLRWLQYRIIHRILGTGVLL